MGIDLTCTPGAGLYRAVGVEWWDHLGNAGTEVVRNSVRACDPHPPARDAVIEFIMAGVA